MSRAGLDAAVSRRERRVHRCGSCGSWLYADRPCVTCQILEQLEDEPLEGELELEVTT